MFNYIRKNKILIMKIVVVLLISTIGIYIRFYDFATRPLTSDEPNQCEDMDKPFRGMIVHMRSIVQFPGDYFLVRPFYRLTAGNKWGAAAPHILTTILSFYLLYILCNKYFKTLLGFIITFLLFTFNYNLRFYYLAIRPYSVMVTLGIMAFLAMGYIVEQEKQPLSRKVFISIFIFITLLYHLYSVFILIFPYLFHLLSIERGKKIWKVFFRTIKYYSPAVVASLPFIYYFSSGYHISTPIDPFAYIQKGVIGVAKGVFGNLTGLKIFYFLLPGILVSFLIPHKERKAQILFFLILILAQMAVIFFLSAYFKLWFVPRMFIWVVPLFAFFLGWVWDSIIYNFGKFSKI